MKTDICELMEEAHQTAKDKGWWEKPLSFAEQVALGHSEYSEALEEYRDGRGLNEFYYETQPNGSIKPLGVPSEMADVIIRVFDVCAGMGIDIMRGLEEKMAYNKTREYRHGNKIL